MRVCAVICEYNPFHLGHAYHLRAAREASGADYVLCLMSGALTQRGAFARHDKWLRARAALENGADVVLELNIFFLIFGMNHIFQRSDSYHKELIQVGRGYAHKFQSFQQGQCFIPSLI